MRILISTLLLLLSQNLFSQDLYHTELLAYLSENFEIENPEYLIGNSENANISDRFNYGPFSLQNENVTNQSFSIVTNCNVNQGTENAWNAGMGNTSSNSVDMDDVVLVTFWAKRNSASANVFIFAEDNVNFEKQFYFSTELTPDWSQYFIAFKSTKNFASGRLATGFHLGAQAQNVDIAGFTALNYGSDYTIDDVPNTYSSANYGGHEEDAEWRAFAASRIETLRKADLVVNVLDQNNNVVSGADVRVEMQEHAFGFGSAFVSCRFEGNNCYNPIYVEKITNLDGKGHGFNVGVMENAMKWDGWEEEWISSPDQLIDALEYIDSKGIEMRGHALVWPGFGNLPNDIQANADNLDYILNRIDGRITQMIEDPVISNLISDWDILNEITTNDDLEKAFDNYPAYESGVDLYKYIFQQVKLKDPDMPIYVNDFVILSGAGASETVSNRYKGLLSELKEAEVPFDGIGFQCHIGSLPTSINKLQSVWDEYFQRYNVPLKVTEYDVNPTVSEETQAKYMEDFLTMCFSHPAMEAFLMWGFWDGNHWKDNAAMYDFNWNLKPSGEAFVNKVFNEWWTEEDGVSNIDGIADFRPFKGTHKVIVKVGDAIQEVEVDLENDTEISVNIDLTTSVNHFSEANISIYPNPTRGQGFAIDLPEGEIVSLEIYNSIGKLVKRMDGYKTGTQVEFNEAPGVYMIELNNGEKRIAKPLVVK